MKKFVVLLWMLLPLGAFSQELKIAYVNADEIFNLMPELTEAETTFATIQAEYEKGAKELQDLYNSKYEEFMKIQDTLTENLKLRKQQELEDISTRFQNYIQSAQQDMQQERTKIFAPIQEKMRNAIKAVGDEQGYTCILDQQSLLHIGSTAIDATQLVKTKLGIK